MNTRESYLRVLIGLAIFIFVVQIVTTGMNSFSLSMVVNKASLAISIALLFHYVFSKWIWKFKILRPLIVKVPCLHGTWIGILLPNSLELQNGDKIPPIEIRVYIRQTFNYISVEMHTDKMISTSYIADFIINADTGVQDLCYTYTSKSKVQTRDINPWHDGTTKLSIFDGKTPRLEGEYWTARKTIGTIVLERVSKEIQRY